MCKEVTEIGNTLCLKCSHVRSEHHWDFCDQGCAHHLYCEYKMCRCSDWVEGEIDLNANYCDVCETYYTEWNWHFKLNQCDTKCVY